MQKKNWLLIAIDTCTCCTLKKIFDDLFLILLLCRMAVLSCIPIELIIWLTACILGMFLQFMYEYLSMTWFRLFWKRKTWRLMKGQRKNDTNLYCIFFVEEFRSGGECAAEWPMKQCFQTNGVPNGGGGATAQAP